MSERPAVPGAVLRPLVEPVACHAWALVHRRDATHPALATLRAAAAELAGAEGWRARPAGAWLPGGETR
ncbi:hypothetical protein [Spirilliplanes yamanashiensis]|nr:hypothetical protein [Spirilliplanes yamanashiensis]MDP9815725.1 hypothetical protein [Spirilliplanes yamanashiensis]